MTASELAAQIKREFGLTQGVTQYRGAPAASTRKFYNYHTGTDFATPAGTKITPQFEGKIVNSYLDNTGYGLRTGVYNPKTNTTYYLSHLQKALLPAGSTFKAGQPIALSGGIPGTYGAGNTTGAHLDVVVEGGLSNVGSNTTSTTAPYTQALRSIAAPAKFDINTLINAAKAKFGNKVKAIAKNPSKLAGMKGQIVKVTL